MTPHSWKMVREDNTTDDDGYAWNIYKCGCCGVVLSWNEHNQEEIERVILGKFIDCDLSVVDGVMRC